jgi:hypothetical protein
LTKQQIELVGSITETKKLKAGKYFSETRKIANEVGFVREEILRDFRVRSYSYFRAGQSNGSLGVIA